MELDQFASKSPLRYSHVTTQQILDKEIWPCTFMDLDAFDSNLDFIWQEQSEAALLPDELKELVRQRPQVQDFSESRIRRIVGTISSWGAHCVSFWRPSTSFKEYHRGSNL